MNLGNFCFDRKIDFLIEQSIFRLKEQKRRGKTLVWGCCKISGPQAFAFAAGSGFRRRGLAFAARVWLSLQKSGLASSRRNFAFFQKCGGETLLDLCGESQTWSFVAKARSIEVEEFILFLRIIETETHIQKSSNVKIRAQQCLARCCLMLVSSRRQSSGE